MGRPADYPAAGVAPGRISVQANPCQKGELCRVGLQRLLHDRAALERLALYAGGASRRCGLKVVTDGARGEPVLVVVVEIERSANVVDEVSAHLDIGAAFVEINPAGDAGGAAIMNVVGANHGARLATERVDRRAVVESKHHVVDMIKFDAVVSGGGGRSPLDGVNVCAAPRIRHAPAPANRNPGVRDLEDFVVGDHRALGVACEDTDPGGVIGPDAGNDGVDDPVVFYHAAGAARMMVFAGKVSNLNAVAGDVGEAA